jgi:hypothetical protein
MSFSGKLPKVRIEGIRIGPRGKSVGLFQKGRDALWGIITDG